MPKIGLVGAGQMARALSAGWVQAGLASAPDLVASDVSSAARTEFERLVPGCRTVPDVGSLPPDRDVIVLAVKPQVFPLVAADLRPVLSHRPLIVSVMAGVTLDGLANAFGTGRIVRVMPNTPALVGEGAAGYAAGPDVSDADLTLVGDLMAAVGLARQVDESLLDAVTALSGSGPAMVFLMIEALADGGVAAGLSRELAISLAAQTVKGAATMVLTTGDHPGELKDRVASPAGTTIAALGVLEDRAVRGAFIAAVEAAARRARKLGKRSAPTGDRPGTSGAFLPGASEAARARYARGS